MTQYSWSPQELAFLNAIHSAPRDDATRLIYADWLEEHGQEQRAEFIRLQCQRPYIVVVHEPPEEPRISFHFDFHREDPRALERRNRLLALVPHVYRVDGHWREEHFRGLPLLQEEIRGDWLAFADRLLGGIGPAARLDLNVQTKRLADWLAHPVMERVDRLHIWPDFPEDAERDADCTMNSHYDAFWAENIPILAASQVIDRLYELNPCGCHSTGDLTARSIENMGRCRELLEPRVYVEYSY
ncbi:MAG TPA: TIGR02996 domain-containing protein [Gemmataceae bacterium]|jgi:uncharacterized protein (TIGR02996 family)